MALRSVGCLSTAAQKTIFLVSILILVVFFLYSSNLYSSRPYTSYIPEFTSRPTEKPLVPPVPDDYAFPPWHDEWCERAYGHQYIQSFRDEHNAFCDDGNSLSSVECFTTRLRPDSPQTFCVAKSVLLQPGDKPFKLDCTVKDWERRWQGAKERKPPSFWGLPKHMFNTGPGNIIERFFDVSNRTHPLGSDTRAAMEACAKESKDADDYKILVLRDPGHGSHHWHSMWEIIAFHWTIDALRSTPEPSNKGPYFTNASASSSQLILLDNDDKGAFFDMWKYFAHQPELRLASADKPTCLHNVLIPLPGGANPLWYGDHSVHDCTASPNLHAYVRRVLSTYNIRDRRLPTDPLTVTVVERHTTRKLKNFPALLTALRAAYPKVVVKTVDWGDHDFAAQLQIAAETDVLVGVHGAGLAMQLFMPSPGAVVEIVPFNFDFKGYRNLARLVGHRFFSGHALENEDSKKHMGWQSTPEVEVEDARFLKIVGAAVDSMLNARNLADDVA